MPQEAKHHTAANLGARPARRPVATPQTSISGFLSFTLHAHLPYVINHGTWPHGLEWLHEAAAETYLPFLRMLGRLERDGIALHCNLDLSPILLEQLVHPVFVSEFPNYVTRKIVAAREDEAFFLQLGDSDLAVTARYWQDYYVRTLIDFNALGRDITSGFRHFNDAGLISIITSAATHGFLPLLGTDESIHAQIQLAVDTHKKHLGVAPKGMWLPECGYRPAGYWDYPSDTTEQEPSSPAFERQGVEHFLAHSGLSFFFVDTHLVQKSNAVSLHEEKHSRAHEPSVYLPHLTGTEATVAVFARDPQTAVQVWSSDIGYPGDFSYLDFHKKRFPGGHRYWKVTGANVGIADKQTYDSEEATERVRVHATHFVGLVRNALQTSTDRTAPPILNALFDAELFGHWWFEGIHWLEQVARQLHAERRGKATDSITSPIELTDCAHYLASYPPTSGITMHEGSWGVGGSSQVWLNPQTSWTYARLYPAQLYVRAMASATAWRSSEIRTRIARQLCRELLLLESSDWQFLISTGAARDYAELRFNNHYDQFNELRAIYENALTPEMISSDQATRLAEIELRDSIFPGLDPGLWASTTI